jgi:hypothetical protein
MLLTDNNLKRNDFKNWKLIKVFFIHMHTYKHMKAGCSMKSLQSWGGIII